MRKSSLFALLLAIATIDASAKTIVVQVRTDLVPVREFSLVRTEIRIPEQLEVAPGGVLRKVSAHTITRKMRADSSRNWMTGVRVAEFHDLRGGLYNLKVAAIDRVKRSVVVRPVRVNLKDNVYVVTVLLAHPNPAYRDRKTTNQCFIEFQKARQYCREKYGHCRIAARGDEVKLFHCHNKWKNACEKQALDKRVACDIKKRQTERNTPDNTRLNSTGDLPK